jgi:hypothetical protein
MMVFWKPSQLLKPYVPIWLPTTFLVSTSGTDADAHDYASEVVLYDLDG